MAEPASEGEMLAGGRGEMVEFVRNRGFWDGSFQPPGHAGSIRYLHQLGAIDERTLCVHAVHLEGEEIRILAGRITSYNVCYTKLLRSLIVHSGYFGAGQCFYFALHFEGLYS